MYSITRILKFAADRSMSQAARKHSQTHTAATLLSTLACCVLLLASGAYAQQNNTINTVAGGAPVNPIATSAAIPNPTGIAEDSSGNIYIASPASFAVYKVTPTGMLSVVAGIPGISGYTGNGGPAASATLLNPVAVAVDNTTGNPTSGNVYIVDSSRIRVVSGGTINVFSGSGQLCVPNIAACGDGGPYNASGVNFYEPLGIYVDSNSNVYISDTGDDKVRFINPSASAVTVFGITVPAGYITTVAGNGLTCNGPTYTCGDGGSSIATGSTGARLDLAVGVATDSSGNLYIGDTRDQRIRCVVNVAGGCPNTKYTPTTVGEIVTYAGSGIFCTVSTNSCNDGQPPLDARFHNPSGVWLDSSGNLYIADQWDNKIREVVAATSTQAAYVTTLCGTGAAGTSPNGTPCRSAELDGPLGVILDASNNLTIADSGNSLVRQASMTAPGSRITTVAGETVQGTSSSWVGDGGPATAATLANPADVAWNAAGTIYYIADSANNRIREVYPPNSGVCPNGTASLFCIETVAGNGEPSEPGPIGDGGPATSATLDDPQGVAVDANGNIYIADSVNSVVRLVNMQSTPITVDKNITIQPGDIETVAGSGTSCEDPTSLCGDGGPAIDGNIAYPSSVALDGQGNLYIADYYDNRIRVVNLSSGIIENFAGTGTACNGGLCGDGGPANSAELHYPWGVASDSAGDVYISDSKDNRVRCVIGVVGGCGNTAGNYAVGTITTYAFDAKTGFSGDGGLATKASMTLPLQVALDPSGNLYAGAGADSVVQRIDAPSQTVITVAGNPKEPGAVGFAGDGGPSTLATLDNLGMSVSGSEVLLIADQGNNRIRQVDMVPVADLWNLKLTFPATTVGQTSSSLTAKLENSGLASLPISSVQISGPQMSAFQIVPNASGLLACTPQLSPGPGTQGFCYVTVTFTPQQTGKSTATLTINTSLGAENVALSGTGEN
jgi:trimeric autotransporter adhesin